MSPPPPISPKAIASSLLGLLALGVALFAFVNMLTFTLGRPLAGVEPSVPLLFVAVVCPAALYLANRGWFDIRGSAAGLLGHSWVVLGVTAAGCAIVLSALVPVTEAIGEQSRDERITANLARIGRALHDYNDRYGHLPPPAICDDDGTPLSSWRVALLPFLGEEDLYQEFHLDEPWHSPHNAALLARMPPVYAAPGAETDGPGSTFYQLFVGEVTVFDTKPAPRIPTSFLNGTSNTVLAVEAGQAVPWTKPADLAFDPGDRLPELGTPTKGGILFPPHPTVGAHILLADGSVHFFTPRQIRTQEQGIRRAIDQRRVAGDGVDW
jgi:hypothetical protein